MKSALPTSPFETRRRIGTVCEVGPTYAKINLPSAAHPEARRELGERFGAGEVGELVCFECGAFTILGRLTAVKLPESERMDVEVKLGLKAEVFPFGVVQLLSAIDLSSGRVMAGLPEHPRLGSLVYSAPASLISHVAEQYGAGIGLGSEMHLEIGTLPRANQLPVKVTPERLFGRHCAVLGTTGGGKSYTLARIIEQCCRFSSRAILLDATGEFASLGDLAEHVHIGNPPVPITNSIEVVTPYSELNELDLFTLFSPSGKVQGPKLREAIRSLRLAKLEPALAPNGFVKKEGMLRATFEAAMYKHAKAVNAPSALFDVSKLTDQIDAECIYPNDYKNKSIFGGDNGERVHCVSLITRINAMLGSEALAPIFQTTGKTSIFSLISTFLKSSTKRLLRISLEHVRFDYCGREIIANAIGRDLLIRARQGEFFHTKPCVIFLDEAHQFLDRCIGDDDSSHRLDAFDLIAKEGRKYWLTICLSTQRPRDIPHGVLSQMGTLIVHRLINDQDREVVERAAGEIDKTAAAFLPTLAPGEAAVVGVDFPIPLTIQIQLPSAARRPKSTGPDFQRKWKAPLS